MNTALWIVQGLLAAMFTFAGVTKTTQPREILEPRFPWVKDFSLGTVRFIGASQLLVSIGLIVPMLTGIAPILTPLAAMGLCLIMLVAAIYHIRKNEFGVIGINVVFFALAAFVAYGRF